MAKRLPCLIVPNGFESNFTLGFVRGLAANGVDLHVLSCEETAPALDGAGISNQNIRGSLSGSRSAFRKTVALLRYYFLTLWSTVRFRRGGIHFCGLFRNERVIFEGIFLNAWFRIWSGRYIYTVHNVLPHSREHSKFFRLVYRWVYKMPNVLLVHTGKARRQLIEEFAVPESKIRLSSLGLNEEAPLTGLSSAGARRRLGINAAQKVILFFGKIDKYKGLDLLIEAFGGLETDKTMLLIAGEYRSSSARVGVALTLRASPREDDIQTEERYITNDEIEVFMKCADVLCLPYRNIYQSGVVFLASRFGLPMVCTDVGELRDFVGTGRLGVVTDSNDAEGVRIALDKFFRRQDEFPAKVIQQRVSRYRWDRVCADLTDLYAAIG